MASGDQQSTSSIYSTTDSISFPIDTYAPASFVGGAGAALVQESTLTDQRLVTPPPSTYSNINMVNNNSFSTRPGYNSSIGYGHTYANNEQQADPNSTAPTNFLGSTTNVVNNNSFTIENYGPNSSVDGAGAALAQKSTSTNQRLVTPPPSNYSNINVVNNNSFPIDNYDPPTFVGGAGAALIQKFTSIDRRLVVPPSSNDSEIRFSSNDLFSNRARRRSRSRSGRNSGVTSRARSAQPNAGKVSNDEIIRDYLKAGGNEDYIIATASTREQTCMSCDLDDKRSKVKRIFPQVPMVLDVELHKPYHIACAIRLKRWSWIKVDWLSKTQKRNLAMKLHEENIEIISI